MPCPLDSTGLFSSSRSLHDLLVQWLMDRPPLCITKENTCLILPNPSPRPCSQESCGPHLIHTRAPGQGQDRLDPQNSSPHPCTHTPPSLHPITNVVEWLDPLILGLSGALHPTHILLPPQPKPNLHASPSSPISSRSNPAQPSAHLPSPSFPFPSPGGSESPLICWFLFFCLRPAKC